MIIEKLRQLEQESQSRGIPIVGAAKGAWLFSKVQELKPRRVLELGTANGYSGCILGSEGAELTTLEIDDKIATEAKENFAKFNINATIIVGDGVSTVKDINGEFDLIFY